MISLQLTQYQAIVLWDKATRLYKPIISLNGISYKSNKKILFFFDPVRHIVTVNNDNLWIVNELIEE